MAKADNLLKVVLTPLEPPEGIVKNYVLLCVDNSTDNDAKSPTAMTAQRLVSIKDDFIKMLELKASCDILFTPGNSQDLWGPLGSQKIRSADSH
jgi:hypothetical protein